MISDNQNGSFIFLNSGKGILATLVSYLPTTVISAPYLLAKLVVVAAAYQIKKLMSIILRKDNKGEKVAKVANLSGALRKIRIPINHRQKKMLHMTECIISHWTWTWTYF